MGRTYYPYESQRLGGTGPDSGIQYRTVVWAPDSSQYGTLISERFFPDLLNDRLILKIRVTLNKSISTGSPSCVIRSATKNETLSILSPGVTLFRTYADAADQYNDGTPRVWSQGEDKYLIGSNSITWITEPRFMMDTTQEIDLSISEDFANSSMFIQIWYLTGKVDDLIKLV